MKLNEISLLWRLRRGERQAFESVVREHYQSVYRQHFLLTNDRERASDLTQETFVEAWRSIPRFAGRSGIRTWLYTIAVRVWRRKGQFDKSVVPLVGDEVFLSPDASPETKAIQTLQIQEFDCALSRLPIELHEVLVLHYQLEMTQPEVAIALHIPIGTVKSRISEGLKRIRKVLQSEENYG